MPTIQSARTARLYIDPAGTKNEIVFDSPNAEHRCQTGTVAARNYAAALDSRFLPQSGSLGERKARCVQVHTATGSLCRDRSHCSVMIPLYRFGLDVDQAKLSEWDSLERYSTESFLAILEDWQEFRDFLRVFPPVYKCASMIRMSS